MKRAIDESEVLALIAAGDSAYSLLVDADPNLEKRFRRLCTAMNKYLSDVREHFPDAEYYTASGGFNLLLAGSHDDKCNAQPQVEALNDLTGMVIGDGDY